MEHIPSMASANDYTDRTVAIILMQNRIENYIYAPENFGV